MKGHVFIIPLVLTYMYQNLGLHNFHIYISDMDIHTTLGAYVVNERIYSESTTRKLNDFHLVLAIKISLLLWQHMICQTIATDSVDNEEYIIMSTYRVQYKPAVI